MPILTGKTIGQLTQLTSAKEDMLFAVEYTGSTYHIPYSSITTGLEFTGNTSGDCIIDLYVRNLYGCSPITIHDSLQSTGSTANGVLSTAFGTGTTSNGNYSHAEGKDTFSNGEGSHAEGTATVSGWKGFESPEITNGTITLEPRYDNVVSQFTQDSFLLITSDNELTYNYLLKISGITYDVITSATTIQLYSKLTLSPSYVYYVSDYTNLYSSFADINVGTGSHSEGSDNKSVTFASHSEGRENNSYGIYSHSEGSQTISWGRGSHSEGNSTISFGSFSHTEGNSTESYGIGCHAEGFGSNAGSVGFIGNTFSSGVITLSSSYSSGVTSSFYNPGYVLVYDLSLNKNEIYYFTSVTYNTFTSKVELYITNLTATVSGPFYVVDTNNLNDNLADYTFGSYSHSEGYLSKAVGSYSNTSGIATLSFGVGQNVVGKYNEFGDVTTGAFIIGNGLDLNNRSNLLKAAENEVNISGKTITTNFQMTSGASTSGYVLVNSDGNGNAQWQSISGITGVVNKYSTTLISPSVGTHTITHNLGTSDISVSLYLITADEIAVARIRNRQTNSVDVVFSTSPGENVRVVIIG
jgi:hypothetical protein